MKIQTLIPVFIISILSLYSCENRNENSDQAKVVVSLVDAPTNYEAVYVDVQDVLINPSPDDEGWISLDNFQPFIVNLLELTNGNSALLGEVFLPEGQLSQLRLILGENNSLVTEDDSILLTTPSAQQSGLKLNINQSVFAGVTYHLILDFDASKSIVKAGNSGKYILKPVIRAEMEALSGAIRGTVFPTDIKTLVQAIAGEDTASTFTGEDGGFFLVALPEGMYQLHAIPDTASNYDPLVVDEVPVFTGNATLIDTLYLEESME